MKALVCRKLGDPTKPSSAGGALSYEEWVPNNAKGNDKLPPTGVRVRVAAAALNFADMLMVQGLYQEKPPLPFVPGGEFAGEIIEVGDAVPPETFRVGQNVAGMIVGGGAMADEVVVAHAESGCFPVPPGVDLRQAAAFPVAYGTSHIALVHRAKLKKGQTVLVLGAAGGVGMAAVQIAKALGAKVVAVARGADKMYALKAAGADACIDSDTLHGGGAAEARSGGSGDGNRPSSSSSSAAASFAGLKAAVTAALGHSRGVDVLYDPIGGAAFKQGLRCVAWGGQCLVIGFASGHIPKLPLNLPLVKNITVHGVYWGSHAKHAPAVLADSMRHLLVMLMKKRLHVNVSHAYSMEEAHLAFKALAERRAVGKVVVVPPTWGGGDGCGIAAKL